MDYCYFLGSGIIYIIFRDSVIRPPFITPHFEQEHGHFEQELCTCRHFEQEQFGIFKSTEIVFCRVILRILKQHKDKIHAILDHMISIFDPRPATTYQQLTICKASFLGYLRTGALFSTPNILSGEAYPPQ